MMAQPTITARDVRIVYKTLKSLTIRNSLLSFRPGRMDTFEAIHPMSFETHEGDVVGIIGKNGSGKSTLLRAVSGIFSPDSGEIETYGNTVSLMALGVGFRPDLSGRENIFLSGLLLGYRESQIRERLDEIIEFSELGDFIDRPVRTYSSGMFSKLAFSISAIMEPDILLIDEVLSVGDAKFKKKSYQKIRTLLFPVSSPLLRLYQVPFKHIIPVFTVRHHIFEFPVSKEIKTHFLNIFFSQFR